MCHVSCSAEKATCAQKHRNVSSVGFCVETSATKELHLFNPAEMGDHDSGRTERRIQDQRHTYKLGSVIREIPSSLLFVRTVCTE